MNMIDIDTIDMLKDVLADEFNDLIRVFLEDAEKHVDEIKLAIEASDLSAIEKSAHTLKGSSSNIGALGLSSACDNMVKACRANVAEEFFDLFVHIESGLEQVKPILVSHME